LRSSHSSTVTRFLPCCFEFARIPRQKRFGNAAHPGGYPPDNRHSAPDIKRSPGGEHFRYSGMRRFQKWKRLEVTSRGDLEKCVLVHSVRVSIIKIISADASNNECGPDKKSEQQKVDRTENCRKYPNDFCFALTVRRWHGVAALSKRYCTSRHCQPLCLRHPLAKTSVFTLSAGSTNGKPRALGVAHLTLRGRGANPTVGEV